MTQLAADLKGDHRDGRPPLVFLHGFGASARAWDPVIDLMPPDYPLIVYDLPGHAGSLPGPGIGGAGAMARAILDDLGSRGIDRIHLAGHSMGGAIAALMTLRAGERVCSLMLAAPGGFGPEINHRLLDHYRQAVDVETMRMALEGMFGFNSALGDETIRRLVAMRRQPGAIEALKIIFDAMFIGSGETSDDDASRFQGVIAADALAEISCPVALVWGRLDGVLPVHQAAHAPAGFTVTILHGAGHMLPEERPDVLAEILQAAISG